MKIPLSWLKEFVPLKVGAEGLAQRLTLGGFEVEEILTIEGEKVLEVNVSPNRGDCLSIFGIAREVASLLNLPLCRLRRGGKTPSHQKKGAPVTISVRASRGCPQYAMAVFSGVKVFPSPDWIVRRLATVGIRSINNVVDITNYVMMERGQPLHAFDLRKISGKKIFIRMAQDGESLLTLDGEEQELTKEDLVIADHEKPIALAGMMGGKDSEIDEGSTEVGIESAFFDPVTVRRSAKRLGIQTESSYRFERRVDFEGILPALDRAGEIIQELSGGKFEGVASHSSRKSEKRRIAFLPEFLESRLGGRWSSTDIRKAFQRLSFPVAVRGGRRRAEEWEISVPSYRSDIIRREDLIEEVCRLYGLERIPLSFPPLFEAPPAPAPSSLMERRARRLMAGLGLHEVIHLSFLSPADLSAFDPALMNQAVTLANPLGTEYSVMRPTLLPSLLKTAAFHHRHKIFNVRLFELRKRFFKDETGVREGRSLAVLLTGQSLDSHWSGKKEDKEADFFDLKGILERLFDELGCRDLSFEKGGEAPFLHPGRQASLRRGGVSLGLLGEIHPEIQERFELKKNSFVFELDWDLLVSSPTIERYFAEYSRTPIVERDLALVVDEQLSAGSLADFIRQQDPVIREVTLFDLYRGAPIVPGKKSLAFSILLGQKDRTLTDDEIQAVFGRVTEGVKKTFGAEVR